MNALSQAASPEVGFRLSSESESRLVDNVLPYFTGRRRRTTGAETTEKIDDLISKTLGTAAIGQEFSGYRDADRMYESLLESGLSQIAYPARDILEFGHVRPETKRRVGNELVGMALDALGKPFNSEFSYQLDDDNNLVAENGESVVAINQRGLRKAQLDTHLDPKLAFRERRFEADVAFITRLQEMAADPEVPVGTALAATSACPNPQELGVSSKLLKKLEYQPDLDMAAAWVGTKTGTETEPSITLKTANLFHATPELLSQTMTEVTGQTVHIVDRETSPWYQIQFFDKTGDAAERTPKVFDALQERDEPTIHGLTYAEAGSKLTAEQFLDTEDFQRTLHAAEDRLIEAAESIAHAEMHVPADYLKAILSLRKPNGEFELEADKRTAVLHVLNSEFTDQDFITTLKAVHTAVRASLWAKISQLYHNDPKHGPRLNEADSLAVSIQVLTGDLVRQLTLGRIELGCSGGGFLSDMSIFNMSPDQQAIVIFGSKDERGSLVFQCENGHTNIRPRHHTIKTCTTCGCSVDC